MKQFTIEIDEEVIAQSNYKTNDAVQERVDSIKAEIENQAVDGIGKVRLQKLSLAPQNVKDAVDAIVLE